MTDFTKTITAAVNCFGQGPASLWNAYNWNAFNWGEGTADIRTDVWHLLTAQTVTPADGYAQKRIAHLLTPQTVTLNGMEVFRSYAYTVVVTASVVGDMGSEGLTDGSGYSYVYPDRTTEGESRAFATWTEQVASAATWATAGAAPSTTWSEA
jgi:hypothetical protein